jgi:hypothetical protein
MGNCDLIKHFQIPDPVISWIRAVFLSWTCEYEEGRAYGDGSPALVVIQSLDRDVLKPTSKISRDLTSRIWAQRSIWPPMVEYPRNNQQLSSDPLDRCCAYFWPTISSDHCCPSFKFIWDDPIFSHLPRHVVFVDLMFSMHAYCDCDWSATNERNRDSGKQLYPEASTDEGQSISTNLLSAKEARSASLTSENSELWRLIAGQWWLTHRDQLGVMQQNNGTAEQQIES